MLWLSAGIAIADLMKARADTIGRCGSSIGRRKAKDHAKDQGNKENPDVSARALHSLTYLYCLKAVVLTEIKPHLS